MWFVVFFFVPSSKWILNEYSRQRRIIGAASEIQPEQTSECVERMKEKSIATLNMWKRVSAHLIHANICFVVSFFSSSSLNSFLIHMTGGLFVMLHCTHIIHVIWMRFYTTFNIIIVLTRNVRVMSLFLISCANGTGKKKEIPWKTTLASDLIWYCE